MKNTNRIISALLVLTVATHTICGTTQLQTEPEPQSKPPIQSNSQTTNTQADQTIDAQFDAQTTESAPISADTNFENMPISPEQLKQIRVTLAQMMDSMVTKIIQQTGRIEELLQDLSLSVNNNAIGGENKDELLEQIKRIRTVIDSVKSAAFVEVEPQTLQFLLAFNEAVMEHLSEAIKKGFKAIPAINEKLEKLHKRAKTISIDTIEDKLFENEEQLGKLKKEAQQIGIRWHNKLFRKLNNLLVIAHRRKWDVYLPCGLAIGAMAIHCLTFYTPWGYNAKDKLEEQRYNLLAEQRKAPPDPYRDIQSEIDSIDAALRKINGDPIFQGDQHRLNLAQRYYLMQHPNDHQLKEFSKKTEEIVKNLIKENGGMPGKTSIFKWPGRLFRKLIGMPPIISGKKILNADKVSWIGRGDLYIKEVSSTFMLVYLPVIAFMFGPGWASNLGGWLGRRMASVYGRLLGGVAAKLAAKQKEDDEGMEPKHTFDDVVGLDHIKVILNNILEYIKDPERFDRANIPPERGYLFTGLPGTGKSFVAEAFGGEIRKIFKEIGRNEDELGFYSFSAEFINEKGIGWLLNLAKKESPCIIFIDEIDLLRLQRGNGNSELLSEFLGSMSGVLSKESGKQVILLAATNRPEHLDRALRRRGRFGKIINFELPTLGERRTFFVKKLDPLLPDLSKIDIDKLAEETEGRTYEELTAMTNAAFQKTKILGQAITQQHLEDSLDEEIRNVINKKMHVSKQEQELISSHQAGHALALELFKPRRKLAAVTIKPITAELQDESVYAGYYGPRKQKDVQYGQVFTRCSFDHLDIHTKEEKIKEAKVLLSGMIAERILLGACGHSYHTNDKQEALDLIKSLVFEGLHAKTMPKKLQQQYFEKALKLLQQYEEETEALLKEHEDALRIIAQELQKYKTLSARKVKALVQQVEGGEALVETSAAAVVV